jgi:hypothetical protein
VGNESRINEEARLIGPVDQTDQHAPPDYVAGTGLSDRPSKENTPAGHITQPST